MTSTVAAAELLLLLAVQAPPAVETAATLPARVRRIVLHVPGGPSYERPERRWVFFTPRGTQALWKSSFGTHWILWTDGSLWPRHARRGDPASVLPPSGAPADAAWRRRLAAEASPVYSHVHGENDDSVGIEVSHSGRSQDVFPPAQVRSLAWLLRALLEMSEGRLAAGAITGHKDLDARPAYANERCEQPGCPVFVDDLGRPFRRRVDPPESLFRALEAQGLAIPRSAGGDDELVHAEALPARGRPKLARQ